MIAGRITWLVLVLVIAVSLCGTAQFQRPGVVVKGYTDGYIAGRDAAAAEMGSGPYWGGLLFGVFYLLWSALVDGKAPDTAMMARVSGTEDYKRGFLEGYQAEWKRLRTSKALSGVITAAVIDVAVIWFVSSVIAAMNEFPLGADSPASSRLTLSISGT